MATHEVSNEMFDKALKLCKVFMHESWADITADQLTVERIKGGLSNEMYKCILSDDVVTKEGEPRVVLLRMYGQILYENPETVVTDSVVYALLAEKKMGPKLYGTFTGGRVEQYVKSHTLVAKDLHRTCISLATAKIMGDFHKLKMPLIKEPRWLFETTTRYLDDGLNNASMTDKESQAKLQKCLSYGLSVEFVHLKKILSLVNSPVVFCHNDLQEGNILFEESSSSPEGWRLLPIDFEYASYNYRAFDIANHFCEWMYDYHCETPPYYTSNFEDYPTEKQQKIFYVAYLQSYHSRSGAGDAQNGKDFENEVITLMKEVDAFRLMSHFFWGVWAIVQALISKIKFGYLDYALVRFDHYFTHKKELLEKYEFHLE